MSQQTVSAAHHEKVLIRAADLEVMLSRIVFRWKRGAPLNELMEKADDLLQRVGTRTPLHTDGEKS